MVIIIEGIDRVGKTTLCNLINEKMNLPIHKHINKTQYNVMDNDNETDKMLNIIDVCNLSFSDIIFDRFHLSEYVYGCIERKYDEEKALLNFYEVDTFIKQAILIYVEPVDIKVSSGFHGSDLSLHKDFFEKAFEKSNIKNKYQCNFYTLNEAVDFVKSVFSTK